jgi:hypothetical protein
VSERSGEQRRRDSERVWGEIRRRIESLESFVPSAPAGSSGALWHQRAIDLAEAPDRDSEAGEATLEVLRLGDDSTGCNHRSARILRVGRVTPVSTAGLRPRRDRLRGAVVAVLDLREFFGWRRARRSGADRRRRGRHDVGILAERVGDYRPAGRRAQAAAACVGIAEDYVAGIAAPGGRMIVVIDLERCFATAGDRRRGGLAPEGAGAA